MNWIILMFLKLMNNFWKRGWEGEWKKLKISPTRSQHPREGLRWSHRLARFCFRGWRVRIGIHTQQMERITALATLVKCIVCVIRQLLIVAVWTQKMNFMYILKELWVFLFVLRYFQKLLDIIEIKFVCCSSSRPPWPHAAGRRWVL